MPKNESRYISPADTAKLVRAALKKNFPGQKFSVRSSRGSGSSIDINWIDGPTTKEVDAITDQFAGGRFDGMIDLAYSVDHWLLPDGTTVVAHNPGTTGSRGSHEPHHNTKPHPDAELVWFGAKYVFTNRQYSAARLKESAEYIAQKWGFDQDPTFIMPEIEEGEYIGAHFKGGTIHHQMSNTGYDTFQDLVHRHRQETSYYQATTTKAKPSAPQTDESTPYRIEHDRDWTWLFFDAKPHETTRDALKARGARWSGKHSGWYFRETIDKAEIAGLIANISTASEAPESKPISDPKRAASLRQTADKMENQIQSKLNPAIGQQRPTRRRANIAASMEQEGRHLQQIQARLYALSDAHEAGAIHPLLAGIRYKNQLEVMLTFKTWPGCNNDWCTKATKTLLGAGLTHENYDQARQALVELITTPQQDPIELQIRQLERNLLGWKIPGFFPTPKPICKQLVELADIHPGDFIAEPSAGNGNIAEVIRENHPDATLTCIEVVSRLVEILQLKGFTVQNEDFLDCWLTYDRIVMNPPFENNQDIYHVRHAFDCLRPGGRLVSIMSEGVFFRNGPAAEFRDWLEEMGGWDIDLPTGAFNESGTGVKTRIVIIDKPSN